MNTVAQTILVLLVHSVLQGRDHAGRWNGIQPVQQTQLNVVHVTKTNAPYEANIASPNQCFGGIKETRTSIDHPSVKFDFRCR